MLFSPLDQFELSMFEIFLVFAPGMGSILFLASPLLLSSVGLIVGFSLAVPALGLASDEPGADKIRQRNWFPAPSRLNVKTACGSWPSFFIPIGQKLKKVCSGFFSQFLALTVILTSPSRLLSMIPPSIPSYPPRLFISIPPLPVLFQAPPVPPVPGYGLDPILLIPLGCIAIMGVLIIALADKPPQVLTEEELKKAAEKLLESSPELRAKFEAFRDGNLGDALPPPPSVPSAPLPDPDQVSIEVLNALSSVRPHYVLFAFLIGLFLGIFATWLRALSLKLRKP